MELYFRGYLSHLFENMGAWAVFLNKVVQDLSPPLPIESFLSSLKNILLNPFPEKCQHYQWVHVWTEGSGGAPL